MRQRARTDLCGGRSAMIVPTATLVCPNRASAVQFLGISFLAFDGHSGAYPLQFQRVAGFRSLGVVMPELPQIARGRCA